MVAPFCLCVWIAIRKMREINVNRLSLTPTKIFLKNNVCLYILTCLFILIDKIYGEILSKISPNIDDTVRFGV